MTERKPPGEKVVPSKEYYEKVRIESREALLKTIPSILLYVITAVLVTLFARLVFLPIAGGIKWYGYPLPEILNFIILVTLLALVARIFVDVRRAVDAIAGIAACEIGAPYDVSPEEVGHYKTAFRGIVYVIVVSLAFMLFAEHLTNISSGLSAVALIAIVVWAIYQIWSAVRAVSKEIDRYASEWTKKIR
ncbi:hypothetical protein KAW11_00950 [Candidatus Bathyarchaeota archaeon]|nr:hypothetical protein [Candidatus Bathyarchaeota archaeon]